MSYQLISTSGILGNIDKELEALTHRVNALIGEGYEPVGGPVVRNNPEAGDYFIQAMFKPKPPMVVMTAGDIKPVKIPASKKPAPKVSTKKPAGKR